MLTLTGQITETIRRSPWQLIMGMKGLSSYSLAGKMSTPIAQMRIIGHHSGVLLLRDMREWLSYCLARKMSTPIARTKMAEHDSNALP